MNRRIIGIIDRLFKDILSIQLAARLLILVLVLPTLIVLIVLIEILFVKHLHLVVLQVKVLQELDILVHLVVMSWDWETVCQELITTRPPILLKQQVVLLVQLGLVTL